MTDFSTELVKYRERISKMPHINAKDFAMGYFFPLMGKFYNEIAAMGQSVDTNFDDVFKALGVDADYFVLRNTRDLLIQMGTFLDQIMLAAGFAQQTPAGFGPTDKLPDAIRLQYLEIPAKLISAIEGLTNAMEDDGSDSDDDDDDDDDEDAEDAGEAGEADETDDGDDESVDTDSEDANDSADEPVSVSAVKPKITPSKKKALKSIEESKTTSEKSNVVEQGAG